MKAAPVDLATGELTADRLKIATPQPAAPEPMADIVGQLVAHFDWSGPVGVTFPGVVRHGVTHTAANLDGSWIGVDADALFTAAVRHAGPRRQRRRRRRRRRDALRGRAWPARRRDHADVRHRHRLGLFVDGMLVPNTELGHLEIDGHDAESRAAASAREREGLSWRDWAERVERYLRTVVALFSPELIVVGGGASRQRRQVAPAHRRRHRGRAGELDERGRHRRCARSSAPCRRGR